MSVTTETLHEVGENQHSIQHSPEKAGEVTLDPSEDPVDWPTLKKWVAVGVISAGSFCVTFASSMASFTETGMAKDFHVSHEPTILSISLFVLGLGIGPLITGPFSEVYGRSIIYRVSYVLLVILGFPIVFAPNLAVFLVFRFLQGMAGASFLSVAGGSVADMFVGPAVSTPMAVYTASPFLGPVFGPAIGGFMNQHLDWRWTYRISLIWMFVETIAIFLFVPESYAPVLLKKKAARLRKETGDNNYWAPLDRRETSMSRMLYLSCTVPFKLLLFDRMALLLDTWTAVLLGILYLFFQAFPIIFQQGHHFNVQMTGLTFLGIGLGMAIGLATQPWWNQRTAKVAAANGGKAPPEALLVMGQVGGVLIPISMFIFAFTTYTHVHWIAPIIASVVFGTGMLFAFTTTFTYLVVAYRPIAASAMAANSAMRSSFAAAFPLFAGAMYKKLGTVGATALLAGLMTLMAPLPFIFHRIGPRLRAKSRYAI
ncbi:RNA polymerase II-associated protein [Mycena indigotica]|uniref:RNA polymerase II-associated protein n=1 Tax=Mycena indigotica TaxID=2126181 RepID=A0A8H6THQ7_9AGAR|nr:RNA polymerase II-associated protein [Mycena indigotica]KAF7315940.1 RNA polymerase II-associated protein [Mycena indigotica]